jgi:hypothetical protein
MALLPKVPVEDVTTPQVRSSVTGSEVAAASPFGVAADVLDYAGKRITANADAYQHAVDTAYIAKSSSDARTAAQNIAYKANGDPSVFDGAWKTFSDQTVLNAPARLRETVAGNLETVGGEGYRGVVTTRHSSDIANAKATILGEISNLNDESAAIARNGGTQTPDYLTRQQKIAGFYNQLSSNPAFGFPPAEAELELRQKHSQNLAEGIIGTIDQTYKNGSMADAED